MFSQAKLAAKKAKDLANLHQIALAVTMYVHDNDGVYPRLVSGEPSKGLKSTYLWSSSQVVGAYAKSVDILVSPADHFSPYLPEDGLGLGPLRPLQRSSYLPNAVTQFSDGRKAWGVKDPFGLMTIPSEFTNSVSSATAESSVTGVTEVVMLANGMLEYYGQAYGCPDKLNNEVDPCMKLPGVYADWLPTGIRLAQQDKGVEFWRMMYPSWRKFAGGSNFAMVDSHVKFMKPEEVDRPEKWLANTP